MSAEHAFMKGLPIDSAAPSAQPRRESSTWPGSPEGIAVDEAHEGRRRNVLRSSPIDQPQLRRGPWRNSARGRLWECVGRSSCLGGPTAVLPRAMRSVPASLHEPLAEEAGTGRDNLGPRHLRFIVNANN